MRGIFNAVIVLVAILTQLQPSQAKPLLGTLFSGEGRVEGGASLGGSVVAGASGGSGGLLSGLLSNGVGGIAGSLTGDLVNTLTCLLSNLNQGVINDVLLPLADEDLQILNEICNLNGGGDILLSLVSDVGLLKQVLCLIEAITKDVVFPLLENLVLADTKRIGDLVCQDGVQVKSFTASVSELLGNLVETIGVDDVLDGGLDAVLDLDSILSQEGVLDINGLLKQIVCLLQSLRIGDVADLIGMRGVTGVLNIEQNVCSEGGILVDLLFSSNGTLNINLLMKLECLLSQVVPEVAHGLFAAIDMSRMQSLNEMCNLDGDGNILLSLVSDIGLLNQVLCLVEAITKDVVFPLLENLGLADTMRMGDLVCQDGVAVMGLNASASGLLGNLVEIIGVDGVLDGGLDAVLDLDSILSQQGVLDINGLLKQIVCLLQSLGIGDVADLIGMRGVAGVLNIEQNVCSEGGILLDLLFSSNGTLNINLLMTVECLLSQVVPEVAHVLFGVVYTSTIQSLNEVCNLDGGDNILLSLVGDYGLLDQILCLIERLAHDVVFPLLENLGLMTTLGMYESTCPYGNSASMSGSVSFSSEILAACSDGTYGECSEVLLQIYNIHGCGAVCPTCSMIEIEDAMTDCETLCSNQDLCPSGANGDAMAMVDASAEASASA